MEGELCVETQDLGGLSCVYHYYCYYSVYVCVCYLS